MQALLCLTAILFPLTSARLGDFENGITVQAWTCDETKAQGQQWILSTSDKTIRLKANQLKCVDVSNYGTDDGTNIWLWDCHTNDKDPAHQNQEFNFNSNQTATSVMSDKCISAVSAAHPSNVEIDTCSGGDNQLWTYNQQDSTLRLSHNTNLCLDVGSLATCQISPWNTYPYCQDSLDRDARANDLLNRLTLEDKVSLMQNDHGGVPGLAVPPFGHTECTHGTLNDGQIKTTLFPQAITFARSFNRQLVYKIARAISDEVRAKHNTANSMGKYNYPFGIICWAPVVNVCRDPRWGRCQEGYGEDPHLQGELGFQYVKALQNSPDSSYTEAIATCKHFDVHTGPENIPASRSSFDSVVNYRDWIETFQPAFKACNEAGAMSYMCSYNAINGVPACANSELLTWLLRTKWGFKGFVVSDCGAVGNVYHQHHFARSDIEAATFCVSAGCDWNCGSEYSNLLPAVRQGFIAEEMLNISVTRLIKGMLSLGVFDSPGKVNFSKLRDAAAIQCCKQIPTCPLSSDWQQEKRKLATSEKVAIFPIGLAGWQETGKMGQKDTDRVWQKETGRVGLKETSRGRETDGVRLDMSVVDKHVPLNRMAAQQSIVLIKNKKSLLPLKMSNYKSVALIGPCADDVTCARGDYDPEPNYIVSTKQALMNRTNLTIQYAQGCKDVHCADDSGFADAVSMAKSSDLVMYVGGISKVMEGEGNDRSSIVLPGKQPDLITQLLSTGKPVVVVVYHGAPVVTPVYDQVDTLLSAGYTGQESGNAVLDILTGEVNPSGRLVVTWYTGDDQLPPMVSYSMINRTYRYMEGKPMFYFGYGLSYTSFSYSNLKISPTTFTACQTLMGSVEVTNTGSIVGDEVVQVYMSFMNATVPAPKIKLVDFAHISSLAPGKVTRTTFTIKPEQMTVVRDRDYAEVIEPGLYIVYTGGSQPNDPNAPAHTLTSSFSITGPITPLDSC